MNPSSKCGQCRQSLSPEAASMYFCDIWCQSKWYMEQIRKAKDRKLAERSKPAGMAGSAA